MTRHPTGRSRVEPGDLESLCHVIDALAARGRAFIADSVLDPIHFGLSRSLARYVELRDMLFAAREDQSLPRGYDASLCALHERKPSIKPPYSESEIAEIAAEIRDPSYRVNVSVASIYVYNCDGMTTATDPFDLYPRLDLLQGQEPKNTPHAFYMGVELGRAQIAWQLGKRYVQDEPLNGAQPCVPRRAATPRARMLTNPRARP